MVFPRNFQNWKLIAFLRNFQNNFNFKKVVGEIKKVPTCLLHLTSCDVDQKYISCITFLKLKKLFPVLKISKKHYHFQVLEISDHFCETCLFPDFLVYGRRLVLSFNVLVFEPLLEKWGSGRFVKFVDIKRSMFTVKASLTKGTLTHLFLTLTHASQICLKISKPGK